LQVRESLSLTPLLALRQPIVIGFGKRFPRLLHDGAHDDQVAAREVIVGYTDKTLTCQDCGQSFTFSADDQEYFATKGYSEPKRCPSCRAARKAERGGGGGGGGGGGYRAPREMHQVICAECGQETEVPFAPRGDRPVYCSSCFSKRSAGRFRS
jgi:CxxC-x17-CxxC domain-containing protein